MYGENDECGGGKKSVLGPNKMVISGLCLLGWDIGVNLCTYVCKVFFLLHFVTIVVAPGQLYYDSIIACEFLTITLFF